MSDFHKYADIVEALILATDRPIAAVRLASVATKLKADDVPAIVDHLNLSYEETGRAFRIREIAGAVGEKPIIPLPAPIGRETAKPGIKKAPIFRDFFAPKRKSAAKIYLKSA